MNRAQLQVGQSKTAEMTTRRKPLAWRQERRAKEVWTRLRGVETWGCSWLNGGEWWWIEVLPEKWRVKFHLISKIWNFKLQISVLYCVLNPGRIYICSLGVRIASISCSFGVLWEHGETMTSCNFTSQSHPMVLGIGELHRGSLPALIHGMKSLGFAGALISSLGKFVVFYLLLGANLKQKQGLETRQGHDDAEVELGPLRAWFKAVAKQKNSTLSIAPKFANRMNCFSVCVCMYIQWWVKSERKRGFGTFDLIWVNTDIAQRTPCEIGRASCRDWLPKNGKPWARDWPKWVVPAGFSRGLWKVWL